jgi:hypothetical protein
VASWIDPLVCLSLPLLSLKLHLFHNSASFLYDNLLPPLRTPYTLICPGRSHNCYSFSATTFTNSILIDMYDDQLIPSTSTLLRPLNIDIATPAPPDAHPHHDEAVGTFQVPIPGGGSILVKDPAGSSMSLNLGIDPSSGTPILSGRAITAQGDFLDVHPCSCSNPVSPQHRLPPLGSPELTRSEALARDHSHLSRPPNSPIGVHRRPAPILTRTWTPLVVVQTQLPHSPSGTEFQQNSETPAPETHVDSLQSPFTPTPASVQRRSQSPSTRDTYHTCSEDTSAPPAVPTSLESQREARSPLPNVPPRLDTIPEQSPFDIDLESPLVQSPSPVCSPSEISAPSALGSLLSSPSYSAEFSTSTVMPRPCPVVDVQPNQAVAGLPVNRPPSRNDPASHGGGIGPTTANVALPATGVGIETMVPANPLRRYASSISDLYTNRDADDQLPPVLMTVRAFTSTKSSTITDKLRRNTQIHPGSTQAMSQEHGPQVHARIKWGLSSTSRSMGLGCKTSLCLYQTRGRPRAPVPLRLVGPCLHRAGHRWR